jgi:hypothetical protein
MLQCCEVGSESSERLQIRSHDIGHTADIRITPEIVHGATPLPPTLPKSFQRYIQTDFVPILKAIGYRLSRIIDLDRYTLDETFFNPRVKGVSRETHYVQWKTISPRLSCLDINGHPDLKWSLSSQFVET